MHAVNAWKHNLRDIVPSRFVSFYKNLNFAASWSRGHLFLRMRKRGERKMRSSVVSNAANPLCSDCEVNRMCPSCAELWDAEQDLANGVFYSSVLRIFPSGF